MGDLSNTVKLGADQAKQLASDEWQHSRLLGETQISKHRLLLFVRFLLEVLFLCSAAEIQGRSRAGLYCYCHGKEKQGF